MARSNMIARLNNRNPNRNEDGLNESGNVVTQRVPVVAPASFVEADDILRSQLALDFHGYTQEDRNTIDRICIDLLREHDGVEPILDVNIRMRFVVDIVRSRFGRLNLPLDSHGPFTVEEESVAVILRGIRRVDENRESLPRMILQSISQEIQDSHDQAVRAERAARRGVPPTVPHDVYEIPPMLMWLNTNDVRENPENFLRHAYSRRNMVSVSWSIQRYIQDRELLLDQDRLRATLMPPSHISQRMEPLVQVQSADVGRFRSLKLPQSITSRAHVRTLGSLIDALVDLGLTDFAQVRVCFTSQPNTYRLYFLILDNEVMINKIVVHALTYAK
ncbi:hypothetical protein BJV82DRAFT_714880 [Fennellomyces sp. T-0311]|nr:hypothetical protein BJV82DRAFT_714880 [Fennellomyces sp. T-0311]